MGFGIWDFMTLGYRPQRAHCHRTTQTRAHRYRRTSAQGERRRLSTAHDVVVGSRANAAARGEIGADQWLADIDIDDANGIAHMFQVLRNAITGRPTHPFDVHELLVSYQKLDPGYALIV